MVQMHVSELNKLTWRNNTGLNLLMGMRWFFCETGPIQMVVSAGSEMDREPALHDL